MTQMPWFRVYSEILDDRKIRRICKKTGHSKALVIGVWVCLLALASESPKRGVLNISEDMPYTLADIEDELEVPNEILGQLIEEFRAMGMIGGKTTIEIVNWQKRQFRSDNSSGRVEQYRYKRENNGMPRSPNYDSGFIRSRDNNHCVYCGSQEKLVVDHVVPITQGGTDDSNNLVCACKKCNSGKSGRTPEQAGYKFIDPIAEKRYRDYVTVTGCYSHGADTETETESESDTESETDRASLAAPVSQEPAPQDFISQVSQITGLYPTANDMPVIIAWENKGTIPADIRDALQWRKDNAKPPIKTIAHLDGGVEVARLKRIQGQNAKPGLDRGGSLLEQGYTYVGHTPAV